MTALLKFILVIFLIYLVIKFMYHKLVPEPVRQMITQMRTTAQQMRQQQQGNYQPTTNQQQTNKPEGAVTITNNNTQATEKNTTPTTKEQGDFIDYEEID